MSLCLPSTVRRECPNIWRKNPNGKVPLLELEDGRFLAESNAILLHLAEGTPYLPKDAYERALVYQWLFFEQYSHEPYVAVRRALMVYPERAHDATPERLASTLVGGEKALGVMEEQLNKTPFLVGDSLTVADIALYAYTHEAHRGGFNMERYPAVNAWLARVAADEGACIAGLVAIRVLERFQLRLNRWDRSRLQTQLNI
jgi:glutathione S-transferase